MPMAVSLLSHETSFLYWAFRQLGLQLNVTEFDVTKFDQITWPLR